MKTKTTANFSAFNLTRVRLEIESGYSSLFDAEIQVIHKTDGLEISRICQDFMKRVEELDGHGFDYSGRLTVISDHGHQQIFTEAYPARQDPVVKAAMKEEFNALASIFTSYARNILK